MMMFSPDALGSGSTFARYIRIQAEMVQTW